MRHPRVAVALLFAAVCASAPLLAAERSGYRLSVIVDGCEAPEYEHAGRIYLEALRGRDFSLRISNPGPERVAVALSVDGRNVIDASRTTAGGAAKWILSPGQTVDIPGWQVSGETSRRFFFTDTARSYARWLGDTRNVGTIEAVFFREKRRWPQPQDAEVGSAAGSERSEGPLRDSAAPPSAEARRQKSSEADRYAATGIGDKTDFGIRWAAFDAEREPAARIALRYEFRRELVRLGVLPRAHDALAERERARGFEPRYAPDPYGHR